MSQLYNTIEPNEISQVLLRRCVEDQGPGGEADFAELRLDFQSKMTQ